MNHLMEWLDQLERVYTHGLQGQEVHKNIKPDLKELCKDLQKLRTAIEAGRMDQAVTLAFSCGYASYRVSSMIQTPMLIKINRSVAGSKAVKARHDKRWSADKVKALKRDYKQMREAGKSDYAACRELAKKILKDKSKWRQIRTQIQKKDLPK